MSAAVRSRTLMRVLARMRTRLRTCRRTHIRAHIHTQLPVLMLAALAVACTAPDRSPNGEQSRQAGRDATIENPMRPAVPAGWPERYSLGKPATAASIAALDTDVDTTGAGLPVGHGTAAEGALVFTSKCASCHGARGEGITPSPVLMQPLVATDSFPWATNANAPKTVGNYWPFATTLYGYVRHSMPQSAPGSLTPTEVYAVVAYLLAENGVMPRETVLDAQPLPKVKLPMRSRLVLDTRKGGAEVR